MTMTRLRADLMLLIAALVWGLGFVAQSTAMDSIGPLTFIGLRFLIAAAAIWPLMHFVENRNSTLAPMSRSDLRLSVLIGLVFFAAAAFQQWGLVTTTVTNAGFLTGIYVVIVPFIVWALYRKAPPLVVWTAALMSVAGTFLLSGGGLDSIGKGDLLVIGGALFWALHVTLISLVAVRSRRPLRLATIQFAVCGACGLVLGIVLENPDIPALTAAMPEILYAALIAGALGFTLQTFGQRDTPAADAAIILSAEGVFAALFGTWLLSERLDVAGATGAGLILAAILLVELAPVLRKKRASPAGT